MEIRTTVNRGGSIVGYPSEMVIILIVCRNAINKKYMFAAFLNCWNRLNGMKLMASYFDVTTTFFFAFSLMASRLLSSNLMTLVPPTYSLVKPKLSATLTTLFLKLRTSPDI